MGAGTAYAWRQCVFSFLRLAAHCSPRETPRSPEGRTAMSTLMSPWSGRKTAVMNIVNVGVCVFFFGTQSGEARDNRPGLELGACECICNSNALDGQGEPQFSEPRAYDLPATSDRCSAMTGAFCWVHTGHGVKEGELHVCLWTNSAYSQTPARPGLRPQQPASTASPLTASATVVLRETAACTPIHDGFPETSAENPAAGPPRACPPILDVHALGCTTCHPGGRSASRSTSRTSADQCSWSSRRARGCPMGRL